MVPSNIIKEYLYAKFPDNHVFGQEFTTNSIFTPDEKKHMSINMESGLWQDFKAHQSGNFPQLISYIEEISYEEASKFIMKKVFDNPEALFDVSSIKPHQSPSSKNSILDIFKNFAEFDHEDIDPTNLSERLAYNFVVNRKLTRFKFHICKTGRYANRLIIPFQYESRKPYFFQARNLSLLGIKYLNPSRELGGVKSSDVLFPFDADSDYVFLTEGPLDAISLKLNGINATCTQGSTLSNVQAEQLRGKQLVFAYDNDEAGMIGMEKARKLMLHKNVSDFKVGTLPVGIKDWNELHVECGSSKEFRDVVASGMNTIDFQFQVSAALN